MSKKVLVVGGDGRANVLAEKLAESKGVGSIICAPGNYGTSLVPGVINVPVGAEDILGLVRVAMEQDVSYVVVSPEGSLARGIIDQLKACGISGVGPSQEAARLEASKLFAKEIMDDAGVPTARWVATDDPNLAQTHMARFGFPVVAKADGLCSGKGVSIVHNAKEAWEFAERVMIKRQFGAAGKWAVIESFLQGTECSITVFCDGVPEEDHLVFCVSTVDCKIGRGKMTGGVGSYSDDPNMTPEILEQVKHQIILPVLRELAKDGAAFKGILYAGLMLTAEGPKVLEFNVRMGDPEAQVILPRLGNDFADLCEALIARELDIYKKQGPIVWDERKAVCTVFCADGYPDNPRKGDTIFGVDEARETAYRVGGYVFFAGAGLSEGQVVTTGGRVGAGVGLGNNYRQAFLNSRLIASKIRFKDKWIEDGFPPASLIGSAVFKESLY